MYVPYCEIAQILSKIFPKTLSQKILDSGYELKVRQNLRYIKKNQKSLLKKIKHKSHFNVAFYVYDEAKWKCQALYDLLEKSGQFTPYIFVTKNAAPQNNFNYQTPNDVQKTYDFFKRNNMRVEYAYDIEKQTYTPFKLMNPRPDIIIYQHPWYVETSQGPVVCSEFALTYYVPYFIATTKMFFEFGLRFHQYVTGHFVLNDSIKAEFSEKLQNNGKNLISVGHPQIDEILLDKTPNENKYLIYAPHWSVCGDNIRLSTFDWNGKLIQDFAIAHPELNWVFKPHPLLYNYLISSKFMTKSEVDNYFDKWKEIGQICLSGDYIPLFKKSSALITDCGSFLTEYLITQKPCIHLISASAAEFNDNIKKISHAYYQVNNETELQNSLQSVIIEKKDYKKSERQICLKELGILDKNSSQRIIDEINRLLGN